MFGGLSPGHRERGSGERHPTWSMCAPPFHLSSAGGSCGRLTAGHSSCRALGPRSVGETSPCRARPHGTASRQPADFITVYRDICKETQNPSVQLRAPLRSPSKRRYINVLIHSFIHSFMGLHSFSRTDTTDSGCSPFLAYPVLFWFRAVDEAGFYQLLIAR